ncbi:receptor-type tyrosine-protein phosphatase eta isoform X2 [Electrophorus electricus]|uniref:receptor-type tyrosine-protein phosphatase eta isoform X2 n=1 Tax=Electrophorus electricus TaxID=8005 RepID=UPI0015D076B8|nr:receptor-type tyrosine-protein phosphatase eta isoform X2 [Electrophorus electricus]
MRSLPSRRDIPVTVLSLCVLCQSLSSVSETQTTNGTSLPLSSTATNTDVTQTASLSSIATNTDVTQTASLSSTAINTEVTQTASLSSTAINTDVTQTASLSSTAINTDVTQTASLSNTATNTDVTQTASLSSTATNTDVTQTASLSSIATNTDVTQTASLSSTATNTDVTQTASLSSTATNRDVNQTASLSSIATNTYTNQTLSSFITNTTITNPLTSSTLSTDTKGQSQTVSTPSITTASTTGGTRATSPAFSTTSVTSDGQISIISSTSNASAKGPTLGTTPASTASVPSTVITSTRITNVVANLSVSIKTTSSVSLTWNSSNGNSSFYRVQWTDGRVSNTSNTFYTVTGLTPGVNYTFNVTAVAGDGVTAGTPASTSTFTNPDVVGNLQVSIKTTSSVSLNWNLSNGNSSSYRVQWTNGSVSNSTNTSNTSYTVTGLTPGVKYTFSVTAVAGDGVTAGAPASISIFTKPDVIRNISATEITISSVFLNWSEPNGQRSLFRVLCTTDNNSTISHNTTNSRFFNITGLISGERYTFLVTAIAADNSTEGQSVELSSYTNPDIIRNLTAVKITSSFVYLTWIEPIGKRAFFRVFWNKNSTSFNEANVTATFSNITGLIPGSNYSFNVSAVAADNSTVGNPVYLSMCTNASPVLDYNCEGPNRTTFLNLTWKDPLGSNQGFNITLSGENRHSVQSCGTVCNASWHGLQYSTSYSLSIVTLGCGQSGILNFTCKTGFTEPPIPTAFNIRIINESPEGAQKKKVTIQFSANFLNDAHGPIEAYGVLLSTDSANNSIGFLAKNYDDWMKDMTMTYLTVLKTNENTRSSVNTSIEIEIGNNKTGSVNGTNYINGPLDAQRKYSSALVLFTYLKITGGLVDISDSFFSISPFVTLLNPKPSNTVAIVLGVLSIIILMIIITIILVFIIQKRRTKKNETEIPVNTLRNKVIPVRVEDYEAYFKKQQADSNCGFAEEYENIKVVGTAQAKISALALENKVKNRYNNVLPYDISRVKLSIHGSTFDDYINANYIPGYNSKKEYIAAQGPLPVTVNEFWRMIWEKHVQTMVMLTRCNEQGRVKCEKYWPSETKLYNNIIVTTTSEIALEDWTIRDFTIKNVKTAESREVRHFHFTAWPDHGVPETTEVLINFRHLVREHMDHYSCNSPTIVHCSAGVGRTGTFIALDHLIFQIERESIVDIYGIVHNMRMHRPLMVQTEDQYVFLNQCAVDIIKSRMGTNVDLIYQNATAFHVYGNIR